MDLVLEPLAPSRRQIAGDGRCGGRGCSCARPHSRIDQGLAHYAQAQSHVEGDIFAQSLAIEQGAYFEGKSRRSDNPLAEIEAPDSASSPSVASRVAAE